MIKTFSQTQNGPCEIGAQLTEGNNYEAWQSSLDVFDPFFGLDNAQNTTVVYFWLIKLPIKMCWLCNSK